MANHRGAEDELETLQLIISSNQILFNRVMEVIKRHRMTMSDTILDSVAKKQDKAREAEEKKKKR